MKKTILVFLGSCLFFQMSCNSDSDLKNSSQDNSLNSAYNPPNKATEIPPEINELLKKHSCLTCHNPDVKLVGPAYREVALKNYTPERIVELVHKPEPNHWMSYPPMAPMPQVPEKDIIQIANWINSLK